MARESGEERKVQRRELCMRLEVEFAQEGAEGAWAAVKGGYFDDVPQVPLRGEEGGFEQGELEDLAAQAVENLNHPDFADDLEMHLLPLRLLYLRDLIRQGRVEEAAYQAFRAGMRHQRTNEFPYHYHAKREKGELEGLIRRSRESQREAGLKKRGQFKQDPPEIQKGLRKTAGDRDHWKSEDALLRETAKLLGLSKTTIKRHAPELVAELVAQAQSNQGGARR